MEEQKSGWQPIQLSGATDEQENQEKQKTAVAVSYEPGEAAPKILATGKGYLADKIIEKAKEEKIPFYKDTKLADTLSRLEIGEMIPPELYEVVAEILVFVDDMDKIHNKYGK
jgi:flagellar biosynthesis protein